MCKPNTAQNWYVTEYTITTMLISYANFVKPGTIYVFTKNRIQSITP